MSTAGPIISKKIEKDDKKKVTGIFTFADSESALNAVRNLDKLKICNSDRELKVKLENGNDE